MKKKNMIRIELIVCLVVVASVGAWVLKDRLTPAAPAEQPYTQIEITEQGFIPATLHVTSGTVVTWVNRTVAPRQIAATPFPEGSNLPGLDSSTLAPEDSYSYTFKEDGTFTYADYAEPTKNGIIHVQ